MLTHFYNSPATPSHVSRVPWPICIASPAISTSADTAHTHDPIRAALTRGRRQGRLEQADRQVQQRALAGPVRAD